MASTGTATGAAGAATGPAAAMLKGVVKQVLSGDTLIVRGRATNGPPPERQINLAYITVPRLGRKDEADELFAWEAREFLRKKLVGKEVSFRVDYTIPSTNREFGTVLLGSENLAHSLIAAGLARVRENKSDKVDLTELLELEKTAKEAGQGVHGSSSAATVRTVKSLEDDARNFVEKNKGRPLDGHSQVSELRAVMLGDEMARAAIVERVRDGSTLQVLLLPSFHLITVVLSGVKCPVYRKDVPDVPDVVEPFAAELGLARLTQNVEAVLGRPRTVQARHFTEVRLLQQDVKVILEGLNNKTFVASVIHPMGNIAEALVREGLAKVVDWSITMVTNGSAKLREAEKGAKQRQVRMWKDFKAKAETVEQNFTGKVTRVWNGESITVTLPTGQERKIFLSSVRQPRTKEPTEAPYQAEAKEFLRARLIGKKVHVHVDYVKPAEEGYEERTCATVKSDDVGMSSGTPAGMVSGYYRSNMGEALISKGLATVMRHRQDDDNRASDYDQLLLAEDRATKGKKGIHSGKDVPVVRISDASESAAKAKQFLPTFKRQERVSAIVDYVMSGSRFKLLVPRDNLKFTLVLSGVRTGRVARTPEETSEPYAVEAAKFVSSLVLQHDVTVEVEGVVKVGGFIGSLFTMSGQNVAVELLENGLATIHGGSADQSRYANQLYSAETRAKADRKNLWASYSEEEERAKQEAAAAAAAAAREKSDVNVERLAMVATEVLAGNRFYAQSVKDGAKLDELMAEFGRFHLGAHSVAPFTPKTNEMVSAKFESDGQWYRARVAKVNGPKSFDVLYVDFGNSETVSLDRLRPLPTQFASLPPQAQEVQLIGVAAPPEKSEYDRDSAEFLSSMILNKTVHVEVYQKVDKTLHAVVFVDEEEGDTGDAATSRDPAVSVNARMVEAGLALVEKRRERFLQPLLSALNEAQTIARDSHVCPRMGSGTAKMLNIWQYGDITADDAHEFGMGRRAAAAAGSASK